MKFSKLRQLFLVSSIGLFVAVLFSACQLVTVDYVFLATSAATKDCAGGQIETFAVDSQSGAVRSAASAVCAGGVTPVAMAVSPTYSDLYVANSGDSTVVHFAVSPNGVLASKDTVTLAAPPHALAVSANGKELFVVSGTTTATLTEFPLTSGALGTPSATVALIIPGFSGDKVIPTGVTALKDNGAVYVTAYDASAYNPGGVVSSSANPGWIFGFTLGTDGALTPVAGSPANAGVRPSGIVADPTSRYLYVTDFAQSQLIAYGIYTGYGINFLQNGPFRTGNEPTSIAVDPRGKFLYVANAVDSSVNAYVIDLPTGTPSSAVNTTGSPTNSTDTQPDAIAVDPALGRYVYTANYLGNSISGFRLDPTAGTLKQTQATPYPSGNKPTAIVVIPHGNHAIQVVTP